MYLFRYCWIKRSAWIKSYTLYKVFRTLFESGSAGWYPLYICLIFFDKWDQIRLINNRPARERAMVYWMKQFVSCEHSETFLFTILVAINYPYTTKTTVIFEEEGKAIHSPMWCNCASEFSGIKKNLYRCDTYRKGDTTPRLFATYKATLFFYWGFRLCFNQLNVDSLLVNFKILILYNMLTTGMAYNNLPNAYKTDYMFSGRAEQHNLFLRK